MSDNLALPGQVDSVVAYGGDLFATEIAEGLVRGESPRHDLPIAGSHGHSARDRQILVGCVGIGAGEVQVVPDDCLRHAPVRSDLARLTLDQPGVGASCRGDQELFARGQVSLRRETAGRLGLPHYGSILGVQRVDVDAFGGPHSGGEVDGVAVDQQTAAQRPARYHGFVAQQPLIVGTASPAAGGTAAKLPE